MLSKGFLKLTQDAPRLHSSILLQLRTGHAPLNSHLYRIGRAESPLCPGCGQSEETVRHFLLTCTASASQRDAILRPDRRAYRYLRTLLTDPKVVPKAVKFALASKRFKPGWTAAT